MVLDHTNPDSLARCILRVTRTLHALRGNLRGAPPVANGEPDDDNGLAVRLMGNPDGELWFATGNVQYDSVHCAACESTIVYPDADDDELSTRARHLVEGVASQLAEREEV